MVSMAETFLKDNVVDEILEKIGVNIFLNIYGGKRNDSLKTLW